jgi:hypothetical protein
LFPLTAFGLFLIYVSDKYLFLYENACPPHYDDRLHVEFLRLFPVALLFFCMTATIFHWFLFDTQCLDNPDDSSCGEGSQIVAMVFVGVFFAWKFIAAFFPPGLVEKLATCCPRNNFDTLPTYDEAAELVELGSYSLRVDPDESLVKTRPTIIAQRVGTEHKTSPLNGASPRASTLHHSARQTHVVATKCMKCRQAKALNIRVFTWFGAVGLGGFLLVLVLFALDHMLFVCDPHSARARCFFPTYSASDCDFYSLAHRCYLLQNFSASWNEHADYCELIGGTLASIHTAHAHAALAELLTSTTYFGGMTDGDNRWYWLDESPWEYMYPEDSIFDSGSPARLALVGHTWQFWLSGTERHHAMCQVSTDVALSQL